MIEDRLFDLDELRVRTHRLAIELPVEYNDYFTQVIQAIGRLDAEVQARADLCAQLSRVLPVANASAALRMSELDAPLDERIAELTTSAQAAADRTHRALTKWRTIVDKALATSEPQQ